MTKKKNNGDKLQNYNPNNGEYLCNNDSNNDCELEMILNQINRNKTNHIKFPDQNSSSSYIEEYINNYVDYSSLVFNESKLDFYLLDKKNHYDKAHYFVDILGFNVNNKKDLFLQLKKGIKEQKKYFKCFSTFGINIYCIVHLVGKLKEGNVLVGILATKDNKSRFITSYAYKGDKNERIG